MLLYAKDRNNQQVCKLFFYIFGQFYGKFGILIILVALFLVSSIAVPGFFSLFNLTNILLAIACTPILALGATFVIILGHINIAYGSEL